MNNQWLDTIEPEKLEQGEHHVCIRQDKAIAIFNIKGDYFAIEDSCTHQGLPLSEGPLEEDIIECPFHGARFCIKTGEVKSPPACVNLSTYETRIHNGKIQVKMPTQ